MDKPKATRMQPGGPLVMRLTIEHRDPAPDLYRVEYGDLILCATTDPVAALGVLANAEAEVGIIAAAIKRASGVYPVQVATTLTKRRAEAEQASP